MEEETEAYVLPPAPATAPDWTPEEEADLLGGSNIPAPVLQKAINEQVAEVQVAIEDAPIPPPPGRGPTTSPAG